MITIVIERPSKAMKYINSILIETKLVLGSTYFKMN